jgi:hypothetical protein
MAVSGWAPSAFPLQVISIHTVNHWQQFWTCDTAKSWTMECWTLQGGWRGRDLVTGDFTPKNVVVFELGERRSHTFWPPAPRAPQPPRLRVDRLVAMPPRPARRPPRPRGPRPRGVAPRRIVPELGEPGLAPEGRVVDDIEEERREGDGEGDDDVQENGAVSHIDEADEAAAAADEDADLIPDTWRDVEVGRGLDEDAGDDANSVSEAG